VTLIGATTENPYFSVNSPLLSRSLVFRLEPLSRTDVVTLLERALQDPSAASAAAASPSTTKPSSTSSTVRGRCQGCPQRPGGDGWGRAGDRAGQGHGGDRGVGPPAAAHPVRQGGDAHYDAISAFIKSLRGSDPDAAVWWLAGMLEAGRTRASSPAVW